jgi:transposase-like protein
VAEGIDIVKLFQEFGTDEACRDYLEHLRWPYGVECPKCSGKSISRIKTRKQFDCNKCRHRFSVTTGTVFHDSHLPLPKWFAAVYLLCEAKKGMSALQLKRTLGVAQKTAWYLCHRIRAAMVDPDAEPLSGIVEVDETYIGGKHRAPRRRTDGRVGLPPGFNPRADKAMVMGAVERGGKLRVRALPDKRQETLYGFISDYVADDAEAIYTDSATVYGDLTDADTVHEKVNHRAEEWVRGDHIHTNTVESAWSLFDRAVIGSYHKVSKKHLPAYLQEFEFRFNNRDNPYLFRDTLLRLIASDNLTYKELTA